MAIRPIATVAVVGSSIMACGGDPSESAGTSVPARSTPLAPPTATASTTLAVPAATGTSETIDAAATTSTSPPTTEPPPLTGPPIVTRPADIGVIAPRPVAAPVLVEIPSLGIAGPVLPVGVNAEQQLDVPPDAGSLVWYRHGPSPGTDGSAVIAGHLNWKGATGIFSDLAVTPVGGIVTVAYDDGTRREFTVTDVELVPKPAVSVDGTFTRRGASVLRLVTCGGVFDESVSSYESNVIVTAVPS